MKNSNYIKTIIITALCISLCVVLPIAFHAIPNAANVICPMHIPVLLCGLICPPFFSVLCGLLGPLLSSLITGMPPMAYLPAMLVELAAFGFIASVMMKIVHTKKLYLDLYISLIVSMLLGRILAGCARALIFAAGKYSMAMWLTSYFVTSLPGIIIQLALIPTIIYVLEKSNLIPKRY